MADEIMATTPAETTEGQSTSEATTTQEQKVFTQDELNDIISKRIAQVKSKYEGIDPDEYKSLKHQAILAEEKDLIDRKEFDKLLKKTKTEADKEVTRLRSELEKIKIDGALINAASQAGGVNPEHIAQLLRTNIRMDASGQVTVVDKDGNPRYTEAADPMGVSDLVEEFLAVNTYYRTAGPSGTGSESNANTKKSTQSVDISQLDLSKPSDREIYRKLKREGKL